MKLAPDATCITVYEDARYHESTMALFDRHTKVFCDWCSERNLCAAPADITTLRNFAIYYSRTWARRTILIALFCIQHFNRLNGFEIEWRLIKMISNLPELGPREAERRVAAIDANTLRKLLVDLPNTVVGIRNRAMFLVGFSAALRPAELIGLDCCDGPNSIGFISVLEGRMIVCLKKSKTDVRCQGQYKLIPSGCKPCPILAVREWMEFAKITNGPLFRKTHRRRPTEDRMSIGLLRVILKKAVYASALNDGSSIDDGLAQASMISGHSLRVGFVTSAIEYGIGSRAVVKHVGWSSSQMVFRYVRLNAPDTKIAAQVNHWYHTSKQGHDATLDVIQRVVNS